MSSKSFGILLVPTVSKSGDIGPVSVQSNPSPAVSPVSLLILMVADLLFVKVQTISSLELTGTSKTERSLTDWATILPSMSLQIASIIPQPATCDSDMPKGTFGGVTLAVV